jgi:hypothetical protein
MLKNEFEGFSTLVRGYFNFGPHSGTGFFYCESNHQPGDKVINNWTEFMNNKIWLITARHNIYPLPPQVQQVSPPSESYEERLPYEFRIFLKSNSSPKWEEIILSEDDLLKNGRIHNDYDVDIAAIEITDILKDKLKERTNNHYIDYYVFHKNQFPTSIKAENSRIIIVGFPESSNNLLNTLATKPEIRSGTIKSTWGSTLDSLHVFEVNVITEMGFSGSPVVSVSKDSKSEGEMTTRLNDNQISFLGVSAGISDENNTTIVFYGKLVEEVIKEGLPLFTARYRYVDRKN